MNLKTRALAAITAGAIYCAPAAYAVGTLQGYVGASGRWYPDNATDPDQGSGTGSFVAVPEWYNQWNDRNDSLNVKLFARYDSLDDERSHVDIRELYWQHVGSDWEFTLGINKIFWGVTESQHLVDIINQTDLVEAPDGEEKLGQGMAHLALLRDWGVLDLFVLPGFRPRTFAGNDGRLRSIPVTDGDEDHYTSSDGKDHVDGAIRWSHYIGDLSFGLSWFRGTSRDPSLILNQNSQQLEPLYNQIDQYGLDAQYIVGDWLWKFEGIHRENRDSTSGSEDFTATTAGFEYTWVGFAGNLWDLGLLTEYSHDSRGTGAAPLQDDIFLGGRWSFNDAATSEILFGAIQDMEDGDSRSVFVEASTRIGNATRILIEGFYFDSESPKDAFYSFRQDSYIEIALEYYF
jgi:hypothetical protein